MTCLLEKKNTMVAFREMNLMGGSGGRNVLCGDG